ncbi:hypothetical protein LZ32DRAFT_404674 [Colletotrichum eremochloae]|nr:hypothetical protein LZ32DRAFT_404674 [Colletotrichum eremochloae]
MRWYWCQEQLAFPLVTNLRSCLLSSFHLALAYLFWLAPGISIGASVSACACTSHAPSRTKNKNKKTPTAADVLDCMGEMPGCRDCLPSTFNHRFSSAALRRAHPPLVDGSAVMLNTLTCLHLSRRPRVKKLAAQWPVSFPAVWRAGSCQHVHTHPVCMSPRERQPNPSKCVVGVWVGVEFGVLAVSRS